VIFSIWDLIHQDIVQWTDERSDSPSQLRDMAFHIAPCTDHEWEKAIVLLKRVYIGENYTSNEAGDAFMRREILEAGGTLLLAQDTEGAILGAVLMLPPDGGLVQVSQVGEAEFRVLAVAPEARGAGVGEALVRACITQAKSIGAKAIVLWSQPTMLNAHRLYERLGFDRVPERDQADGRGFTRMVFRLNW